MVFHLLADSTRWKQKRADGIQSARDCKATLTNPNGHWRYEASDPRVKQAVGAWVARARNAHAIALGRRPVIAKFVSVSGSEVVSGPLYVTE